MSYPYDNRALADIIHDFAVTRGDLSEPYAREQLARAALGSQEAVRAKAEAWDEGYVAGQVDRDYERADANPYREVTP